MAYLGRGLDKISNIEVLDNITFDGSSSYSITKNSVAFTPNSAQSCLISIDGVVQATNFTVSSSTIDFGVAIPSTSVCNFFLHYGTGVMTVPSDGSVTTAKLGDGAVTSAKLDSGVLPTNTPSFFAYRSGSVQNFSQNTATKLQFNTELYDTDNCYDNSTNYRFTPTTAGKYYISAGAYIDGTSTASPTGLKLYKNGSFYHSAFIYSGGLAGGHHIHNIVDFNGSSDYAEIFVESGNSSPFINYQPGSALSTFFCAYKIIGA